MISESGMNSSKKFLCTIVIGATVVVFGSLGSGAYQAGRGIKKGYLPKHIEIQLKNDPGVFNERMYGVRISNKLIGNYFPWPGRQVYYGYHKAKEAVQEAHHSLQEQIKRGY